MIGRGGNNMVGDGIKRLIGEMFSKGRVYGSLDMNDEESYKYQRMMNEELNQLLEYKEKCEELEKENLILAKGIMEKDKFASKNIKEIKTWREECFLLRKELEKGE